MVLQTFYTIPSEKNNLFQSKVIFNDVYDNINGQDVPIIQSFLPIELVDLIHYFVMLVPFNKAYKTYNGQIFNLEINKMTEYYKSLIYFIYAKFSGYENISINRIVNIELSLRMKQAKGFASVKYIYCSPLSSTIETKIYPLK